MFDSLEQSMAVLELLAPLEPALRRKSVDLAKQAMRAAESIALNVAEGRGRRDGDQRRHYQMAAGSASELTAALRIARLRNYITEAEFLSIDAPLDRIRAMLYRLSR